MLCFAGILPFAVCIVVVEKLSSTCACESGLCAGKKWAGNAAGHAITMCMSTYMWM